MSAMMNDRFAALSRDDNPIHCDPVFAEFLQTYGQAALKCEDPNHIERLGRLFWFTVEFGLIREHGETKLYGSGLISSLGESFHALESPDVDRRPFDMDRVCDTPFEIDHYQPILYVLDSFEQLADAMNHIGRMSRRKSSAKKKTSSRSRRIKDASIL